jgi:hypothetical protein
MKPTEEFEIVRYGAAVTRTNATIATNVAGPDHPRRPPGGSPRDRHRCRRGCDRGADTETGEHAPSVVTPANGARRSGEA